MIFLVTLCLFHKISVVFLINKTPLITAEPLEFFSFNFVVWVEVVAKKLLVPANQKHDAIRISSVDKVLQSLGEPRVSP